MEHWAVLGLAAILWPLLAVFLWWVSRMPGRERTHSLLVLGVGAVAGIALAALFGVPALLREERSLPLSLLFFGQRMWFQYAAAVPLGALIAFLLSQTTDTHL